MDSKVQEVLDKAEKIISSSQNADEAYLEIFGKNGIFTALAAEMKNTAPENRATFGQSLNAAKSELEKKLSKKRLSTIHSSLSTKSIDVTAPGKAQKIGHLHLVSQAIEEIVDIFKRLGFTLQSYPEVDWDWYAFESLNMPKDHPARDDWETFFVKSKYVPHFGNQVLTPHTSNGQVREMEKVKTPPIRMLNISRCYRRQIDVSHTPMFHQFEGLLVDEGVTIGDLKGTLNFFTTKFFGVKREVRLRPHHFRFTEPSVKVY